MFLLGGILSILNWVGLIDQARSMMDPDYWFTKVILWPHLGLVISVIGFVLLAFLISKEKPLAKAGAAIPDALTSTPSTPIATNTTPAATRLVGDRIFVDVTPEYLMGLFDNQTSIQASKLVSSFIGKWIPKVSGQLGDIHLISPERALVAFPMPQSDFRRVLMYFRGNYWIDRLSVLKPNYHITVLGQIKTVERVRVELDNCELA